MLLKEPFDSILFSTKFNKGVFIICGRGAATMKGVGRLKVLTRRVRRYRGKTRQERFWSTVYQR